MRAVLLSVLLSTLLFPCGSTVEAIGLQYRQALRDNYYWFLNRQPQIRYRSDVRIRPDAPVEEGVDCSRFLYLVHKKSGVPGIKRTTADRMARGEGGWIGENEGYEEAQELDLIWWTFSKSRPNGHVGAFLNYGQDESSAPGVIHSSSGRGTIVHEPARGWVKQKVTKMRRIMIGE